jgi:hypothetical protein
MKVLLLNSGGYGFYEWATFPVEVEGDFIVEKGKGVHITGEELKRVGLKSENPDFTLLFFLGKEVEIIEEGNSVTKPTKKLIGFKIKDCDGDWFLAMGCGATKDKNKAHIYPVDFMSTKHTYQKDHEDVLIPVYQ